MRKNDGSWTDKNRIFLKLPVNSLELFVEKSKVYLWKYYRYIYILKASNNVSSLKVFNLPVIVLNKIPVFTVNLH